MSDSETTQPIDLEPPTNAELAEAAHRSAVNPDDLLGTWVRLANGSLRISLPVTLTVGGLLVSGQLIGAPVYLERVAEQLEALGGGEHSEAAQRAIAETYRERAAEYVEEAVKVDAAADDDEAVVDLSPLGFIHLRDASVFAAGGAREFPFWRGRLSEVSGWSLGA